MIEYAVVSGKNFIGLIEPGLIPLQRLYAKLGINLSLGEAGVVSLVLILVILVSSFFLYTK
ncbi:hypothetical protein [Desulfobacula sp.]|uniref:hypothetical protein n=1 Tax=Desulfobacula sp. TaxID=2593537 RepID=UPI00262EB116|nr:hypothetical protein [Desulfobacula sp.]